MGGRRRIQRQQTLTAALDWSYDLLDPDEQLLLRGLAVFRGSFSLTAAETICHPKAMELLGSLVAKSLVLVTDGDEEARFWLLESVRIYAEGKLVESGESEQLRSAHRDWCLQWVESLPLRHLMRDPDPSRLEPEADNLTAALEWCHQQGQHDLCARIAIRFSSYWFSYFRLSEMTAWGRALDAALPAEDREHRAMAFLMRAKAAHQAREWDVREFAVPRGEAVCVIGFAKVALDRGDFAQASRLLAAVDSSASAGDSPFRMQFDALVYAQCEGILRGVLDPESVRTTQAEGSALSLKEALDVELVRYGATVMANLAD